MPRLESRRWHLILPLLALAWAPQASGQGMMIILVKAGCAVDGGASPICLDPRLQMKADAFVRAMTEEAGRDPARRSYFASEIDAAANRVIACEEDIACIEEVLELPELRPDTERDARAMIPPPPANVVPGMPGPPVPGPQVGAPSMPGGAPAQPGAGQAPDMMAMARKLAACGGDASCAETAITGKPPRPRFDPEATEATDEEIDAAIAAAYDAAFEKRRAQLEAAAALRLAKEQEERRAREVFERRLDEMIDEYAAAWERATRGLWAHPEEQERFLQAVRSPEERRAVLEGECSGRSSCLELKSGRLRKDAEELGRQADTLRREALARIKAAEEEIAEARRRELAAERSRQLAAERAKYRNVAREPIPYEKLPLDRTLPSGGLLRLLVDGDFVELDAAVKEAIDRKYGKPLEPLLGGAYRKAIIDQSRRIFVEAYVLTRVDMLGSCGDELVDLKVGETQEWVNSMPSGYVISVTPASDIFARVPRHFRPYFRSPPTAARRDFFEADVRRIGRCDNPIRGILEANLVRFADHDVFYRWYRKEGDPPPGALEASPARPRGDSGESENDIQKRGYMSSWPKLK